MIEFKIEKIIDPGKWRTVDLESVPFARQAKCFCCESELDVAVQITSDATDKKIRIGQCPNCGYVGYIDRPDASWIENFYNTLWDRQKVTTRESIKAFGKNRVVDIISELGIPQTSRIFEIGTGHGQLLKQCRDAGFTNLYGIEHAPQRAELAAKFADAEVFHGVFGSEEATRKAKLKAPYRVMFSKSVMEHMYDPRIIFRAAGELQADGDCLLISVPNVYREPSVTTLLFLPHLHGFTRPALEYLACRGGYTPTRVEEQGKGLILVAKKGTSKKQIGLSSQNIVSKWARELKLTELHGRSLYWWSSQDAEKTGIISWIPEALATTLFRNPFLSRVLGIVSGVATRHGAFICTPREGVERKELTIHLQQLKLFYK